jgi:hypothetical protein
MRLGSIPSFAKSSGLSANRALDGRERTWIWAFAARAMRELAAPATKRGRKHTAIDHFKSPAQPALFNVLQ